MKLDQLKFEQRAGESWEHVSLRSQSIRIYRRPLEAGTEGEYGIFTDDDTCWPNVDALTAQAVLFELFK